MKTPWKDYAVQLNCIPWSRSQYIQRDVLRDKKTNPTISLEVNYIGLEKIGLKVQIRHVQQIVSHHGRYWEMFLVPLWAEDEMALRRPLNLDNAMKGRISVIL